MGTCKWCRMLFGHSNAFCPFAPIFGVGPLAECPAAGGDGVVVVVVPTRVEVAEAELVSSSFWHLTRRRKRAKWRRMANGEDKEEGWENILKGQKPRRRMNGWEKNC